MHFSFFDGNIYFNYLFFSCAGERNKCKARAKRSKSATRCDKKRNRNRSPRVDRNDRSYQSTVVPVFTVSDFLFQDLIQELKSKTAIEGRYVKKSAETSIEMNASLRAKEEGELQEPVQHLSSGELKSGRGNLSAKQIDRDVVPLKI